MAEINPSETETHPMPENQLCINLVRGARLARGPAAAILIATLAAAQNSNPAAAPQRPAAQVRELIAGFRVAMMVGVAAELGIPDILHRGPKSAEDLARETGTHAPSVYRVLRTLAMYGVFEEDESHSFRQTPVSELLRADAPASQRELARFLAREMSWRPKRPNARGCTNRQDRHATGVRNGVVGLPVETPRRRESVQREDVVKHQTRVCRDHEGLRFLPGSTDSRAARAGKRLRVLTYSGEPHCFCFYGEGPRTPHPQVALKAFTDMQSFCRHHVSTRPKASDSSVVKFVAVKTA
jgi:hypothetical protein